MKSEVEISLEDVKKSGQTFITGCTDLKTELAKIETELKAVQENKKLQGTAVTQLISSFETIKKNLEGYADKFETIGKSLITSANNKEKIDQEAKKAATVTN